MSLKEKTISGVKWTTLSTVILTLGGIVKIGILTRFLERGDFGLMALVTFVLGFMNLFMDLGLTSAILHKQNITKKEYSSLFWTNVVFSIILFFVMYFTSDYISAFYESEELSNLIRIMAVSIIFSGLGRQFKTIEQKNFNFKFIAVVEITTVVSSTFLAVYLAINNYGVLSLVYSALIQYLLSNILFFSYGIKKNGLLFHYNYLESKPFLKIGIYQVGGQMLNFFNRDIDILIIGKFFDSNVLGGYSLAKQLVMRPMSVMNPIVTKVASPVLSTFQDNLEELKQKYLNFLNTISTVNFTAYLLLILFAKPIILIFYGNGFVNEITFLVRTLSVYMYLRSISSPVGSLVIARGKTNIEFYWNILVLLIVPLSVYIGAHFSIRHVVYSLLLIMIVLMVLAWKFLINNLISVNFKEYFYAIIPSYYSLIKKIKNNRSKQASDNFIN